MIRKEFSSIAWLKTLVHRADLNDKYAIKILCLLSEKDYDDIIIDVTLLVD